VTVTDKNGIQVYARQTEEVNIVPAYYAMAIMQLDEDIPDFGTERGCDDLGAFNQWAFDLRMKDWGYSRFYWWGWSAWERDFKDPHCHPTGLDHIYVDNVDITFYIGHGWPGGFTFVNPRQDDSWLTCDDAAVCPCPLGGWGNEDLEWLALLSCQILAWQDPSVPWPDTMWWQRWGPSFNGLHQILGFDTFSYDVPYFGWVFADSMIGKEFQWLWWKWRQEPLPVRAAWFHAKDWQQPFWVRAAVMGAYGPWGVNNYNDYLWGKGPVGPDIRCQWIRGYWRVTH